MAQWFRALVTLAEDSGSNPRTHVVAHKHAQPQFQGIKLTHTGCTYTHLCKTFIHTKLIKLPIKISLK